MLRDSLSPKNKKIAKKLILIGVPEDLRPKVWLVSSGAQHQMKMNPFYYQSLCELSQKVPGIFDKQIEADLERTEILGATPEEINKNHQHLRQILKCYSLRNPSIGYCQGFNYITNKLFKITQDEETSFWLFSQIIEDILPINYYSELMGLLTDTTIIISVIKELFPDLKSFFKDNSQELTICNFIHKWLIGLFTQNLSEDITNLIWDLFFLEGNTVLIQSSIILFCILKDQLLNNDTFSQDPFIILNDQRKMPNLIKFFIHHFKKESFLYEPNELKAIQVKVKDYYLQTHKQNEPDIVRIQVVFPPNVLKNECNLKYPFCLGMKEIEIKKEGIDCLVFSTRAESINYIEDYYFNNELTEERREGFYALEEEDDCFDILVERREHSCEIKDPKLKYLNILNSNKNLKKNVKDQIKTQEVVHNLDSIAPKKFYVCVSDNSSFNSIKNGNSQDN